MHDSYELQHQKRRYLPLDVDRAKYYRDDRVVLDERESDESSENNCSSLYKYAIFGFNIIFLVVGVALTAMGAWLRTDSRFRDFLSERYRQAVDEAFWQAPTLYTFSYILLVLGATMIVVAFFGCCGAIQGSRLFLGFYGFSVFMLLMFTVSCGVYILYKKDGIDVELSDALNYMVQHYYQGAGIVQESLDRLQQTFRCCGNAGCSDFRAFRQDPPRTCDIRCDGCHYRIWLALRIGFSVALVIFAIVVLAQLVAVAVSMTLIFRNDKAKRRYPIAYYQRHNSAYQQSPPPPPPYQTLPRSNQIISAMQQQQQYYHQQQPNTRPYYR
uniref:Tetraspanin n=1 Tax=Ditylenchus dipsaci TaxID=166011 RepID=A0A915ETD7_9BILA